MEFSKDELMTLWQALAIAAGESWGETKLDFDRLKTKVARELFPSK